MALIIFSLSGCSLDHRSSNSTGSSGSNNTTTTSNVMVLNAVTFAKGETYKLYKGSGVTTSLGNSAKYYVAPITISGDSVTMNLDFASTLTSGEPFVVCNSSDTVVFAYNPNGLGNNFASKDVKVTSGTTGQLSYSSLALSSVSASSLTTGYDENPIEIVLTASDTATVNNTKLTANNYIWHLSPDVGEYWTNGDSTEQLDEDEVLAAVTSADGVYIARDIRYVPNTLGFSDSQTAAKAKDDTESMYVAYYNKGATLDDQTVDADNKWIIAALPTSMGNAQPGGDMGGGDMGGTPPDGSTGGPGSGTDGGTPPSGEPGGSFAPSAVTSFSEIVKAMTHSASDAYDNPVLHITKAGTYKISGTWNGQIWVDTDKKSHVILILNGVTVNCSVAPALVFKKVLEYGPETSSDVASDYSSKTFSVGPNLAETDEDEVINAGATVVLVSGTTNTFMGTNVARINKIEINDDDEYNDESLIGTYVKAQSKMYKLDGAVHSRMSLVIADDGSSSTPGKLIVKSDYEGLDSEMHMYIESGNISVTADDDGINVNEDDVSVFHMDDGTLTINSSGGDGIDSNGYLIFKGGNLNITAGSSKQNSAGEAGIDAEKGVYIYSDSAYTWSAASSSTTTDDESGSSTTTQTNSDGSTTETTTNSDGSSTSITKDADGNTTDTVTTNADGSSTTTVTNPATDEELATITLKASASDIMRSTLTADQRRAQGVLTSGTNFKLVDTYNDFGGVK